jgi:hypothetical protein
VRLHLPLWLEPRSVGDKVEDKVGDKVTRKGRISIFGGVAQSVWKE